MSETGEHRDLVDITVVAGPHIVCRVDIDDNKYVVKEMRMSMLNTAARL